MNTLPGCLGQKKSVPPNDCDRCDVRDLCQAMRDEYLKKGAMAR